MDEIMTLLIAHLTQQPSITDYLGRGPVKIFPGTVPAKVSGVDINVPWVTLERTGWNEEMTLAGGTGDYTCNTSVIVVSATAREAACIYQAIYDTVNGKHNVTWADRLRVQECTMSDSRQVPLQEADGSLSSLQQLVSEMLLFCRVLPSSS